MISIFIGYQNSGKTLAMTYFLYMYYKRGYTIYSNYSLSFPHKKINKKTLIEFATSDKQFNKCIIAIDEIHIYFDSRSFSSKANKIFSYLVLQSSKRDVHIFGTTQEFMNIELRLRTNCNLRIFCNRFIKQLVSKKNKDYVFNEVKSNVRKLNGVMNDRLYIRCLMLNKRIENVSVIVDRKEKYIKAKPLFDLYNTRELINF